MPFGWGGGWCGLPARRIDTAELTRVPEPVAMKVARMPEDTWRLKLADEREWAFAAEASLRPWLGAFAAILQLDAGFVAQKFDEGGAFIDVLGPGAIE